MATGNKTLLCIDRDPSELRVRKRFLKKNGYRVVTATNGHEGLRIFTLVGVDAIVLGYYLGLMDGANVAAAMKQVRPQVPIVMLSENLELPEGAFQTVDALVTKSDGPRFLLSTLQSVLGAELASLVPGKSDTTPGDELERDRPRVLDDLKALIDSFPAKVRQRVIAEIHSVLADVTLHFGAPAPALKDTGSRPLDHGLQPWM